MKISVTTKNQLKNKIIEGEVKEVLQQLLEQESLDFDSQQTIIQLLERQERIAQHERNDTLAYQAINVEKNKITTTLLELLDNSGRVVQQHQQQKRRRLVFWGISLATLLLFSGFSFYWFWEKGWKHSKVIQGKVVTHDGTDQAISDCQVQLIYRLGNLTTRTNQAGAFQFELAERKHPTFTFRITKQGYQPIEEQVTLDFTGLTDTLFTKVFVLGKTN